jgi:hypothetical protein
MYYPAGQEMVVTDVGANVIYEIPSITIAHTDVIPGPSAPYGLGYSPNSPVGSGELFIGNAYDAGVGAPGSIWIGSGFGPISVTSVSACTNLGVAGTSLSPFAYDPNTAQMAIACGSGTEMDFVSTATNTLSFMGVTGSEGPYSQVAAYTGTATSEVAVTVPTPSSPTCTTTTPGAVIIVDTSTLTVAVTITMDNPWAILYDAVSGNFYAANFDCGGSSGGNWVAVVSYAGVMQSVDPTFYPTTGAPTFTGMDPDGLAYDSVTNNVYVACENLYASIGGTLTIF